MACIYLRKAEKVTIYVQNPKKSMNKATRCSKSVQQGNETQDQYKKNQYFYMCNQ